MRKSKVTNKILASIMSAAMIIGTFAGAGVVNTENVKAKDYGISNPRINEDGSVTWDKVKFGKYKQSVDFGEPKPIKWRILSVDGDNNAVLLADEGLDCKPYHNREGSVTWEKCSLRAWLNDDFYNEAFSEAEQALIKSVTVKNADNPRYETEGGNDTTDKVYLLSIEEACRSSYGFDMAFNKESAVRQCKVTDYARLNDAFRAGTSDYAGNGYWWLRSPGDEPASASHVYEDGAGYYSGYGVTYIGSAVRPALQINLSSSLVSAAGEIASDGTVTDLNDGYNNPKCTDEGTVWDCVYFGRYKQNNISEKEAIEWRVLSVDGDEALLLADKVLDSKQYHEGDEKVYDDVTISINYHCTWETRSLRKWLNSDFVYEAFVKAERAKIKKVTIKNDDNPVYGTEGGNDTKDKIFLLSMDEVYNTAYGFNSEYDAEDAARECKVTDYARINGAFRRKSALDYEGNGYWLLRTPGVKGNEAYVYYDGCGRTLGCPNFCDYFGIRPALRINLSSDVWEAAGTVSTGKELIEPDQPTVAPTQAPTVEPSSKPTEVPTEVPTQVPTAEPSAKPTEVPTEAPTQVPTAEPSAGPTAVPTKTPVASNTPAALPTLAPIAIPDNINPSVDSVTQLKNIKLLGFKCARNSTKMSGKVSVSGATVKIKVGNKAYKKAVVKGKKFTLKVARLKKKTKVIIKVTKSGYKSLSKTYKVK